MITRVAVVQKVDLQNRNQQSNSGLYKRKQSENFKDALKAAVRKVSANS